MLYLCTHTDCCVCTYSLYREDERDWRNVCNATENRAVIILSVDVMWILSFPKLAV